MKLLVDLLRISIYTPYLANGRNANILIIAEPESCKTTSMKKVSLINDGILFLSDITYAGLMNVLERVYFKRDVKTLIIGDMWKIFGRKYSTALNVITALNELMEEGIKSIYISRDRVYDFDEPIRMQVIGAITEIPKVKGILHIATTGFFTRMLPFSYSIKREQVIKIFEKIVNRVYDDMLPIKLEFPKEKVEVKIDKSLANRLVVVAKDIAQGVSSYLGINIKGIRYADMLISLAQASALSEGRTEVLESDVEKIIELSNYMNLEFKQL